MTERLEYDPKYSKGDITKNQFYWDEISLSVYLRVHFKMSLSQIQTARAKLETNKFEESNIFQKLISLLWYGFLQKELELTPKKLIHILTNLDQLLPFIPNPLAQKIILILDRVAEEIDKRMPDA